MLQKFLWVLTVNLQVCAVRRPGISDSCNDQGVGRQLLATAAVARNLHQLLKYTMLLQSTRTTVLAHMRTGSKKCKNQVQKAFNNGPRRVLYSEMIAYLSLYCGIGTIFSSTRP